MNDYGMNGDKLICILTKAITELFVDPERHISYGDDEQPVANELDVLPKNISFKGTGCAECRMMTKWMNIHEHVFHDNFLPAVLKSSYVNCCLGSTVYFKDYYDQMTTDQESIK